MLLQKRLLALWRRLFPVRYIVVYRHVETNIPSPVGDQGEDLGIDDMLADLENAYSTCAPMFAWLAREINRLEKDYHAPMPLNPAERAVWQANHEVLNARIAAHNRAIRIPILSARRKVQLKELAEKKAATDAELAALKEFFEE